MQTEVWARRSFKYDDIEHSRGAIFPLRGMRNDESLLRMGYVRKCTTLDLERKIQCGSCGVWFIGRNELDSHGKKNHSERSERIRPTMDSKIDTIDPEHARMVGSDVAGGLEDDSADRAEEKREDNMSPLFLENTKASRDAGAGVIEIQSQSGAKEALKDSTEFLNNVEDGPEILEPESVMSEPETDGMGFNPIEVEGIETSPKRDRSKKKTPNKKKISSRKKTGGKIGKPREKPIVNNGQD